jgi:hypothetical protein
MRKFVRDGFVELTKEEVLEVKIDEANNLKQFKKQEAKRARTISISEPLNNFDVDSLEDRENIQGAIDYFETLSQGGDTIVWTMADSAEQDVTLVDLQGVVDGFALRKAQAFAQYQATKAQIEAIEIPTYDLENIDTSSVPTSKTDEDGNEVEYTEEEYTELVEAYKQNVVQGYIDEVEVIIGSLGV